MKITNASKYSIHFLHFHNLISITPKTHGIFLTSLNGNPATILFSKNPCANMLYGYSIFKFHSEKYIFVMFSKRLEKDALFIAYDDIDATKKDFDYFNKQIVGLTSYKLFEMQYFL